LEGSKCTKCFAKPGLAKVKGAGSTGKRKKVTEITDDAALPRICFVARKGEKPCLIV